MMFAKSKLPTEPSSKAASTLHATLNYHYLHPRQPIAHANKSLPWQRTRNSPDSYNITRDRIDYRLRNRTESKHNRHSAVTINPRSKSGTTYLKAHSRSIENSLNKKPSGEQPREEKLLMMREERLGKIREGFALKNRMGGQKKVYSSVTGNARLNSFTQLTRKHPPQKQNASPQAQSVPLGNNAPKFFDFCESNRYRETRAITESQAETVLPKSLDRGGKVRSMKHFNETPPMLPMLPVTLSQPITPQVSVESIMGSYRPYLQIFQQAPKELFAIRRLERGVYFGQLKGGTFEGRGIIFYHNGKVFEGHFVGGQKEGLGYECYPDRSSYLGNFSQGKRNGRGRFQWSNGEVYDGEWKDGRKEGSGIWKGQDDFSYVGQWHSDTIQGFGVLTQKGTRYEGEFKSFVKSGNGTMRFENGETYTGAFRQNLPNGTGDYYWPNGDNYHGQFINGKRHGQGVLRLSGGGIYRGQFKNDKRSGCGEEFYQDGLHYQGMFENNLKHGWGRLSRSGETIFEGYWVNNKQLQEKRAPFQVIAQQQSVYQRDPSHASMKKAGSTASMARQRFMSRKLGKKSLSKDRSSQGLPEVKPFRRACNCQRHRAANQGVS